MPTSGSAFWADLAQDLDDPDLLREFIMTSVRIATTDRLVNTLDEARKAAGLSKADLARTIGAEPATIRRLFTNGNRNPTLGTLAEVAAALGLQVTLTALPASARQHVTTPLLQGRSADPGGLAAHHRKAVRGTSVPSGDA